MNKKTVKQLNDFEKLFSENSYFGNAEDDEVFSYTENNSYVCLSAPHSTKTTANKHIKLNDKFTGGIVKYLGETCGMSYIVRNKYIDEKCVINSFIAENHLEKHYFLDIHAMKNRPFDLAVGIGYCSPKDYAEELVFIKKLCQKYKLKYVVNHPSYTGQPGLVGRLQRELSQATAMQLEWTKKYRDFNENSSEVLDVTLPFVRELALYLDNLQKPKLKRKICVRCKLWQKLKNRLWYLFYY
ncbi:MAG: hypothetical protein J6Y53_00275 [Alphaproteobacteria bacterium]|nr:hypothetical protein [Alphaproteobacteria bacterium]